MPANAAIAALLTVTGAVAVIVLLSLPAIYARTGPRLADKTCEQRGQALLAAMATLSTRRRDGAVNATALVVDSGVSCRERYQVLRHLMDNGLIERRNYVGITLMPSYVRLTETGWAQCTLLRARRAEREPTPATVTYLNAGGAPPINDDVVSGPSEQHLRELYVALRADAREIYQKGVRADANECADEIERALDSGDRRSQWAAIDRAGHVVALADSGFNLTRLVLQRLFGRGVPPSGEASDASSNHWTTTG